VISINDNNKITVKKNKLRFLIFIILEKLDIKKIYQFMNLHLIT